MVWKLRVSKSVTAAKVEEKVDIKQLLAMGDLAHGEKVF